MHLFQVQDTRTDQKVHGGLGEKMHQKPCMEECPPAKCSPDLKQNGFYKMFREMQLHHDWSKRVHYISIKRAPDVT